MVASMVKGKYYKNEVEGSPTLECLFITPEGSAVVQNRETKTEFLILKNTFRAYNETTVPRSVVMFFPVIAGNTGKASLGSGGQTEAVVRQNYRGYKILDVIKVEWEEKLPEPQTPAATATPQ